MAKAKVAANVGIVFVSAMAILSAWLFETVAVLGVKGGCMPKHADHLRVWTDGPRRVFRDHLWVVDT